MVKVLKPELFGVDAAQGGAVVLHGGRCSCGYVFFPMQRYGCEKCGLAGSDLAPRTLSGRGVLVASVTVHMHARPERKAPFTIGTIRLDDGPVVRTLLTGPLGDLRPGRRMRAALIASMDDSAADLRFQAAD